MFITVQPSQKPGKEKVKVRVDISEISEYRDYPDNSGINKALITYKASAGKEPLIIMGTADEIDQLIKNANN